MTREHKRKIAFLLIVGAALVFFVRTVPQVSLTERAIVLGLGIDIKDGEYTVTAQIINPSSSKGGMQNDGYGMSQGTGKSLSEALSVIGIKTGLTLSLSQCNVLVVGKDVFNNDIFPAINYLVQSFQMPELALMIATDKTAAELLTAKTVLTEISSFQLQQTLTAYSADESVVNTVIKDFIAGYLSENGTVPMVYVTAEKMPSDFSGTASADGTEQTELYEFNYEKSFLVARNKQPLLLDRDNSEAINLIKINLKKGVLDVDVDGVRFSLTLNKKKYKPEISYDNGRICFGGKMEIGYVLTEAADMAKYLSVNDIDEATIKKIEETAKTVIEDKINATFEKCRAAGLDVYGIYGKTYAKEGKRFKESVGDNYLELIDLKITADITVNIK